LDLGSELMATHLILGGARSGKSTFAEQQALQNETRDGACIYYLATAQAHDDEMTARIQQHKKQRPPHWEVIESPIKVASVIENQIAQHQRQQKSKKPLTILVDCLTLWLSNCLCSTEPCWEKEKQALLSLLSTYVQSDEVTLLLVSNEVGHGIVPMAKLSRNFVDQAGWLHQDIAKIANKVDFIMAGIALSLKDKK
jgi:adenosylcobinamide kinase/adenosylcobinamide-phosphate guanylyltransferase